VTRLVPKALRKGTRGQYLVPTPAVTHVGRDILPLSPEGTAVGLDEHCEMLQKLCATKRWVSTACVQVESQQVRIAWIVAAKSCNTVHNNAHDEPKVVRIVPGPVLRTWRLALQQRSVQCLS
jgi:hypothetical protein